MKDGGMQTNRYMTRNKIVLKLKSENKIDRILTKKTNFDFCINFSVNNIKLQLLINIHNSQIENDGIK